MKIIVLSNLRDRFPAYAIITLMLTAMIFITASLMGDLLPLLHMNKTYRLLELDKAVTITAEAGMSDEIKSTVEGLGGKYLGASFRGNYTSDGFAFFQPVEIDYFNNLNYKFRKKDLENITSNISGYSAVIVSSLKGYYNQGETYTEKLLGRDAPAVTFTVVGVLNDDYVYITPTYDTPSSIVSQQSRYIFLITDDDDDTFVKRNVYAALSNNDTAEFCNAISSDEAIQSAEVSTGLDEYRAIELEIMGIPIILQIVSVALCIAGVMSNSLLSMTWFERKYSICLVCGADMTKCRLIQLITDIIPEVLAITAFVILSLLFPEFNIDIEWENAVISLFIIISIFAISETAAFVAAVSAHKPVMAEDTVRICLRNRK